MTLPSNNNDNALDWSNILADESFGVRLPQPTSGNAQDPQSLLASFLAQSGGEAGSPISSSESTNIATPPNDHSVLSSFLGPSHTPHTPAQTLPALSPFDNSLHLFHQPGSLELDDHSFPFNNPAFQLPPGSGSDDVAAAADFSSLAGLLGLPESEAGSPSAKRRKLSSASSKSESTSAPAEGKKKEKQPRSARACLVCRRLKMRCVGGENPPCKRCVSGGHECIFAEGTTSKRSRARHNEEKMERSLEEMKRTLGLVVRQITRPGSVSLTPEVADAVRRSFGPEPAEAMSEPGWPAIPVVEAAPSMEDKHSSLPPAPSTLTLRSSDSALQLSPPRLPRSLEQHEVPDMMSFMTSQDVEELFRIFFRRVNVNFALLQEDFHTPQLVCARSPFLLAAICATASKFYPEKPDLQSKLHAVARRDAFNVLAQGRKTVETVQAYMLLAMWAVGAIRDNEDMAWLLTWFACRIATDLNLHKAVPAGTYAGISPHARVKECLNRERTWLMCFILDRSYSAQRGKPASLSVREDSIIRNSLSWCEGKPDSIGMAAYTELQNISSRTIDIIHSSSNRPGGCDFDSVTSTFVTQTQAWRDHFLAFVDSPQAVKTLSQESRQFFRSIANFYFYYWNLAIFSFGLQNALDQKTKNLPYFFYKCSTFANNLLRVAGDELLKQELFRHSLDSHFVFLTYACVSLLRLARPQFQKFRTERSGMTAAAVADKVLNIANLLDKIAVNTRHMPALCSTFLRALVKEMPDLSPSRQNATASPPSTVQAPAAESPAASEDSEKTDSAATADAPAADPLQAGVTTVVIVRSLVATCGFWDNVVLPGFDGRNDASCGDFLRSSYLSGCIDTSVPSSSYASIACAF